MKIWLLLFILLVLTGISYLFAIYIPNFDSIIDGIASQGFSLLVGTVIGAFGVLMGTITGLFTLYTETLQEAPQKNIEKAPGLISQLDDVIKELKQNTLFLIFALAICIILPVWRKTDLPLLHLSISTFYFSKNIIISTLSSTLIIGSFIGIIDVVSSMFKIYNIYSSLATVRIQQIINSRRKNGC